MTDRIWAIMISLAGAIWIYGGWDLWQRDREDAMFDALGPDRYLMLLGGLLLLCGLIIALGRSAPVHTEAEGEKEPFFGPPVTFTILLGLYTIGIMVIGYTLSTFLFFVAAYYLAGRRKIVPTLVASVVTTVCFYGLFVQLADMNLPAGMIGF